MPAIVQDATTGAVLMLAWMNAEALRLTRETGVVHFWSRSRQALWKKGETSGNTLALVELRVDCDADAILVRAHAGRPDLPHRRDDLLLHRDDGRTTTAPGASIVEQLAQTLDRARATRATGEKSYTRSLLEPGMPKILEKIAEEHGELAAELPAGDDAKVVHETADLLFHVMVGLAARGSRSSACSTSWRAGSAPAATSRRRRATK